MAAAQETTYRYELVGRQIDHIDERPRYRSVRRSGSYVSAPGKRYARTLPKHYVSAWPLPHIMPTETALLNYLLGLCLMPMPHRSRSVHHPQHRGTARFQESPNEQSRE